MHGILISLAKAVRSVRSRPVVKDAISTTAFTLMGRSVGFLIPFFVAAWYGVTQETDAFFFTYGLLLFVISVLGNLFETAVVPFVSALQSRQKDVGRFIGSVLLVGTAVLLAAVALLTATVRPLIEAFTGFPPEGIGLIWNLTLEMVPLVFIVAWTSILNGALNANRVFMIPALSPGVRSLVVIMLTFLLKDTLGIHALAWAYLVGELARLGPSILFFQKTIGPIRWSWKPDSDAGLFFRGASFQTAGLILLGLIPLVNQAMASRMGTGYSSAIFYADRLFLIPSLLLSTGLATVLLSHWSNAHSRKQEELSREKIRTVMRKVILISGGLSLLLFVFRDFIVEMTLHRGAFPASRLEMVSGLFGISVIGLIPSVVVLLYFRLLVIYGKNPLYLGVNILRLPLVVGLNAMLMPGWGVNGIALSNLAANVVSCLALHGYWTCLNRSRQVETVGSVRPSDPQPRGAGAT